MRFFGGLVLLALTLGGCATFTQVKETSVAHLISLDRQGETIDLKVKPCLNIAPGTDWYRCLTAEGLSIDDREQYEKCDGMDDPEFKCLAGDTKGKQLDANIAVIIKHLDSALSEAKKANKKIEVFIFIHSGMVSKDKAVILAESILEAVQTENEASKNKFIYPIFINWESGLMASYGDHLFSIRQGEEAPFWGAVSAPLHLAADLGKTLTLMPITYSYQAYRMFEPVATSDASAIAYFNRVFYPADLPDKGHGIYLGENRLSTLDRGLDTSTYLVPGIIKIVSTPALDFIGKGAWDNMLRRTKTVFNSPNDYQENRAELERCEALLISQPAARCDAFDSTPGGGAYKLMLALGKYRSQNQEKLAGVEVNLIGHSMGTIVASELLQRFSNEKDDIVFDNIVYMAAAATTTDFQQSVIPYLKRQEQTSFYNLTLHPYAEQNEKYYDLVPRGSLLVWIDDFAADPATIADMTFGKWDNAIRALPFVPREIRNRITLKGFGINDPLVNSGQKPQEHSQFNDVDVRFWHHDFWKVPEK